MYTKPSRLIRLSLPAASSASVGNDKPKLANELTEKLVQVRKRETFGHWELDTVVSSRGKSKACVATFNERKTRHYLALRMPDRNASMEVAFGVVASQYPQAQAAFPTATVDRGKEFACYANLENSHKSKSLCCRSVFSWQRGYLSH